MKWFYFHIVAVRGLIRDEEGSELADLDAPNAEAILDARELMSDAVLRGHDISRQTLQICDETGMVLRNMVFADALREPA